MSGLSVPGITLARRARISEIMTLCHRKRVCYFSARSEAVPQVLLEHSLGPDNAFISVLTLNRPKANAMGRQMLQELQEHTYTLQLQSENQCRCLVIQSYSPKVFSAGADLKERATMTLDQAETFVTELRNIMQEISELPMPVIAAIEGVAVGGGLELALACDVRVAAESASLGLVETSLAILPGAGGTQRLPRIVGVSKAKELIFTAAKVTGQQALSIGLVDHLTPSGKATSKALDLARMIAQNGPIGVRLAKHAIDRGIGERNLRDSLQVEGECYGKVLPTEDRLEGLAAFRDGRSPQFVGK